MLEPVRSIAVRTAICNILYLLIIKCALGQKPVAVQFLVSIETSGICPESGTDALITAMIVHKVDGDDEPKYLHLNPSSSMQNRFHEGKLNKFVVSINTNLIKKSDVMAVYFIQHHCLEAEQWLPERLSLTHNDWQFSWINDQDCFDWSPYWVSCDESITIYDRHMDHVRNMRRRRFPEEQFLAYVLEIPQARKKYS